MRLLIVPLVLVCLFIQAPTSALGNANQQAADKIANIIGERFPDADIDVSYRGGQVWLKGEAASQNQREKIVEQIFRIQGLTVTEINDEIQIVASGKPAGGPTQTSRQMASVFGAAVPMPSNTPNSSKAVAATPNNARQTPQVQTRMQQAQQQPAQPPQPQAQHLARQQMQQQVPAPQTMAGALLAPYPQAQYPAAYGQNPGQPPAVPAPFAQTSYVQHPQMAQQQMAQQQMPQHAQQQYQPAYYGPPAQAAYHPEAYGPQGPLPGQYNQPNLPDYAWPAYANYPNYAQVSYPRNYSPKAWPYIGPFYPYPQVPMGWRKVTLEHSNGWWWLDFDDGTPSGPFSGLFRQPQRYTY